MGFELVKGPAIDLLTPVSEPASVDLPSEDEGVTCPFRGDVDLSKLPDCAALAKSDVKTWPVMFLPVLSCILYIKLAFDVELCPHIDKGFSVGDVAVQGSKFVLDLDEDNRSLVLEEERLDLFCQVFEVKPNLSLVEGSVSSDFQVLDAK